MTQQLTTRFLSENEYEKWTKFVCESPTGSVYSLPEYLEILCTVTGDRFRILAVFQGNELVGGIALYETWKFFSLVAVACPRLLLSYHSPVLRAYESNYPSHIRSKYTAILRALIDKLSTLPYVYLNLTIFYLINDMRLFLEVGWEVSPVYGYMVSLKDTQQIWQKMEQNFRRLVNRGIKNGFVFTEDDDFDSFYKWHLEASQRKNFSLYLPEDKYRQYFELLREKNLCKLHQVRLDNGKSIGAFLILTSSHPVSHTVCTGSDVNYLNLGSIPFLRWKSFERLAELGYESNNLTGASLNQVKDFKNQIGGELITNWIVIKPPHFSYRIYQKLTFKD
ncbi:predicted protein [Geminocystis sp. NIES-3708]|uniref:GNAT family N-acetyltransferase n=1 Tax=Geminocystis sp. NIES-3708 TaxID=1615909 RepID=UPI0005FC8696|nr:GNAT family N-acetyltransferase [Geminocystis sp. NIES-3708]BAQ61778.1 predicted protein [Geminocystis sp. NIES-3708]